MAEPFVMVPLSVARNRKLRGAPREVYIAIRMEAKGAKSVAVTVRQLHDLTGYSMSTIVDAIEKLRVEGALTVEEKGHRFIYGFDVPESETFDATSEATDVSKSETCSLQKVEQDRFENRNTTGTTPSKKREKKDRVDKNPSLTVRRGEVFAGLQLRRKSRYPDAEKEAAAINRMLKAGHDPPKILACYDDIKADPWWDGKPLYMWNVEKRIPEWVPPEERSGRLPEGLAGPNPQRPGALRGSAPAPSGRLTDAEREALARRGF